MVHHDEWKLAVRHGRAHLVLESKGYVCIDGAESETLLRRGSNESGAVQGNFERLTDKVAYSDQPVYALGHGRTVPRQTQTLG